MIAGWVNDASNIAGGRGRDGRTGRAAQVTQLTLTPRLLYQSALKEPGRTEI